MSAKEKAIIGTLVQHKETAVYCSPIRWMRADDKLQCRVSC